MILNLWNRDSIFSAIQKTYNITASQVKDLLEAMDEDISYVATFCERTGVKLDKEYLPEEFKLVGRILSTSTDNNESIKSRGLLPIDILLDTESPISSFLKEWGIEINTAQNKLVFRGTTYNIPKDLERCDWCSLGHEVCQYENKKYKNMYCSYLEAISNLSIKLYRDKSEIEMFLFGSPRTMLGYSQVSKFPEILTTINDFIYGFLHVQLKLGKCWMNRHPKTNILTIVVNYKDLSYKSDFIDDGLDGSDLLWEYKDYCNEDYDIPEEAPTCFWDNIWFIKTCMCVLRCGNIDQIEICAGLKHSISISADNILINEIR